MASPQEQMQQMLSQLESVPVTPKVEKVLQNSLELCNRELDKYERVTQYVNSIAPDDWEYEHFIEVSRLSGGRNPEQGFERWRWDQMFRDQQINTRQHTLDAADAGREMFLDAKARVERLLKKASSRSVTQAPVKSPVRDTTKSARRSTASTVIPRQSTKTRSASAVGSSQVAQEVPARESCLTIIRWVAIMSAAFFLLYISLVIVATVDPVYFIGGIAVLAILYSLFKSKGEELLNRILKGRSRRWLWIVPGVVIAAIIAYCAISSVGEEVRVFEGHTSWVSSVAFSPDGRYALSGSWDETLRLWEVETGETVHTFHGHTSSVTSVAFSPDGRYALSGSWDETLRLWEVETGEMAHIFRGHTSRVTSVVYSPDGYYALSGSRDGSVRLWEIETGETVHVFKGHSSYVTSAAFSPDGRYALSGSSDDTLRLWDIETGEMLRVFEGHTSQVTSAAFSPDGRYALSGSSDNTLRLWEVDSGEMIRVFEEHTESVESVAFSPDGRYALSGSSDDTLRLWAVDSGETVHVFKDHMHIFDHLNRSVYSVTFSPDGRYALSGSLGKRLRLWDVSDLMDTE